MSKEKLSQITGWLEEHAYKIIELSFQDGASDDLLKSLDEVVGKTLPADFKELYKWHNGFAESENIGSLFYGMEFYSIEKIIEDYKQRTSVNDVFPLKKSDAGIDSSNMINPHWLSIGFDGSHTSLRIDLAPAVGGTFGQVIFVDEEYQVGILVAKSINELLEIFASDLKDGLYGLDPDAMEDGNHFLIPDYSIDLVNWQASEKWSHLSDE